MACLLDSVAGHRLWNGFASAREKVMVASRRALAVRVQEKLGISNVAAQRIVTAVVESQTELLVEQEGLQVRGLGSFRVIHHAQTRARNPQTGEPIVVPAGKRVKFNPSSVLRRALSE